MLACEGQSLRVDYYQTRSSVAGISRRVFRAHGSLSAVEDSQSPLAPGGWKSIHFSSSGLPQVTRAKAIEGAE